MEECVLSIQCCVSLAVFCWLILSVRTGEISRHRSLSSSLSARFARRSLLATRPNLLCRFFAPFLGQLIILNRNSPQNFTYDLCSSFKSKVPSDNGNLLSIKKGDDINAMYFHDPEEMMETGAVLKRIEEGSMGVNVEATQSLMETLGIPGLSLKNTAQQQQRRQKQQQKQQQQPQQQQQQQQQQSKVSSAAANNTPPAQAVPPPPPSLSPGTALDKKSLQLTLLSLIQDDRFIELIHAQYLKVLKARGSAAANGGGA